MDCRSVLKWPSTKHNLRLYRPPLNFIWIMKNIVSFFCVILFLVSAFERSLKSWCYRNYKNWNHVPFSVFQAVKIDRFDTGRVVMSTHVWSLQLHSIEKCLPMPWSRALSRLLTFTQGCSIGYPFICNVTVPTWSLWPRDRLHHSFPRTSGPWFTNAIYKISKTRMK